MRTIKVENLNIFNPPTHGDEILIRGESWFLVQSGLNWELRREAGEWRTVHTTIRGISAMTNLIKQCLENHL